MNALALEHHSSTFSKTAARFLGKGGTTLWAHEGDGFAVVVYQLHDEPLNQWNLDEDLFDMIELRVISARTDLDHFWDKTTDRVTHWKQSWRLYCVDPDISRDELISKHGLGKIEWEWYDFDGYDSDVDKAIKNAEKTVKGLEKLRKKVVGNHEPWGKALKLDAGDPQKDRFWVCAVYPDDFQWVVRIHRGWFKTFGLIYPRYWEHGYRFDAFSKADRFAKEKVKELIDKGYAELTDPQTLRVLKWSLRAAEEADDADNTQGGS